MDAEFLEKEFEPVFMMNDIINLPKYQIYLKLMIDGIAGDAFSATTLPPIKLDNSDNEQKIINSSRERYSASKAEVEDKIRRWSGMLTAEERQELVNNKKPREDKLVKAEMSLPRQPSPVSGQKIKSHSEAVKPRALPLKETILKDFPAQNPPIQPVNFQPPMAPKRAPFISATTSENASEEKEVEISKEEKTFHPKEAKENVAVPIVEPAKKLYAAKCATCDIDIEVPFIPDGKRPTFCKDCLRDYQRSVAKVRNEIEAKSTVISNQSDARDSDKSSIPSQPTASPKTYVSADAPMLLADMQYVGPKKFKSLRPRSVVNLDEVRALLGNARKNEK
jgi:CxxC-x17-CxxC domain-containing protein